MKADYERQAAELMDVLARLNAERVELANGIDKKHPALAAFAKYQSIETLIREILTDLVDHIKVYENGNHQLGLSSLFPNQRQTKAEHHLQQTLYLATSPFVTYSYIKVSPSSPMPSPSTCPVKSYQNSRKRGAC